VELAERVVTPDAEQTTDLARLVVVIDVEGDLAGRAAADAAPAALPGKQHLVVGLRDAEGAAQVCVAVLSLSALPVFAPVLVEMFLVLLLASV
jgi:hypothetical protein